MSTDRITIVSEKRLRELCHIEREVKALREVEKAARNYFTEQQLKGLSEKYFKDYHAVKIALKNLDEARRE